MKKYCFLVWVAILAAILTFAVITYNLICKLTEKTNPDYIYDNINKDNQDNNQDNNQYVSPDNTTSGQSENAAPDFTLKDMYGNTVSLSDYRGKIVVLNFWASWCGPCQEEMIEFEELDKEFQKSGDVVLLTVNLTDGQRETKEKASAFIKENGYTFTVLFDEEQKAAAAYYINRIPQTYIIDRDGNIHDYVIGMITKDMVLSSISGVK